MTVYYCTLLQDEIVLEQDAAEKLRFLGLELAGRDNCVMGGFIIYIPNKILLRTPKEG